MISDTPFVVIDVETTGLVPSLDKIIEIAAVTVQNGKIVDEWQSLVNPEIFLPTESTHLTGITSEMVQDAPTFDELTDDFLPYLENNSVFVAHNVDFDREFINEHLSRSEKSALENPYMCTIQLARHVHPNLSKYNLGVLSNAFDVELSQAHRALNDAKATAELLIKFMNVLKLGGLKYVKDIPVIQNYKVEKAEVSEGQSSLF